MPMLFVKKEIEIPIEFPRAVFPKVQPKWDGKTYSKIEFIRVETLEEYQALKGNFVLNFKEVTNIVKAKRKAPAKKQQNLEV